MIRTVVRKIKVPEHEEGITYTAENPATGSIYQCSPVTELLKLIANDFALAAQPGFEDEVTWIIKRKVSE